jgi:IS30 family transposase
MQGNTARVTGPGRRLTAAEIQELHRRADSGEHPSDVAAHLDCSRQTVKRHLEAAWIRRRRIGLSDRHLRCEEREALSRGLAAGQSLRSIARSLGRSPSTICREVARNGGPKAYRALRAHEGAIERARRPKPGKLARCPALRAEVEAGLLKQWSPQQISARLALEFPDDSKMQVSHETIYQALYVQSRGELRRQLTANLRTKRRRRRKSGEGLSAAAGSSTWCRSQLVHPESRTEPSPGTGRGTCWSAQGGTPISPPWSSASPAS